MARLKAQRSRLQSLPKRLSTQPTEAVRTAQRVEDAPWRKWYGTERWKALRWQVLLDAMFTCAMCGDAIADTSQLVADHVKPHQGNDQLFWDRGNIQCVCAPCHNSRKQAIERADKKAALYPSWLQPSAIPLTIVCGPPASGKSWYVKQHAGKGDLIIDLDVIASRLAGTSLHGWGTEWLNGALWERNRILGNLCKPSRHKAAWFIVSAPKARHREWWATTLKPQRVVVIEADEPTCMRNAKGDEDRDPLKVMQLATEWWANYDRRIGDERLQVG